MCLNEQHNQRPIVCCIMDCSNEHCLCSNEQLVEHPSACCFLVALFEKRSYHVLPRSRHCIASLVKSLHVLIKVSLTLSNASHLLYIDTSCSEPNLNTPQFDTSMSSFKVQYKAYSIIWSKSSSLLGVLVLASTLIDLPKFFFAYDPPLLFFILSLLFLNFHYLNPLCLSFNLLKRRNIFLKRIDITDIKRYFLSRKN